MPAEFEPPQEQAPASNKETPPLVDLSRPTGPSAVSERVTADRDAQGTNHTPSLALTKKGHSDNVGNRQTDSKDALDTPEHKTDNSKSVQAALDRILGGEKSKTLINGNRITHETDGSYTLNIRTAGLSGNNVDQLRKDIETGQTIPTAETIRISADGQKVLSAQTEHPRSDEKSAFISSLARLEIHPSVNEAGDLVLDVTAKQSALTTLGLGVITTAFGDKFNDQDKAALLAPLYAKTLTINDSGMTVGLKGGSSNIEMHYPEASAFAKTGLGIQTTITSNDGSKTVSTEVESIKHNQWIPFPDGRIQAYFDKDKKQFSILSPDRTIHTASVPDVKYERGEIYNSLDYGTDKAGLSITKPGSTKGEYVSFNQAPQKPKIGESTNYYGPFNLVPGMTYPNSGYGNYTFKDGTSITFANGRALKPDTISMELPPSTDGSIISLADFSDHTRIQTTNPQLSIYYPPQKKDSR